MVREITMYEQENGPKIDLQPILEVYDAVCGTHLLPYFYIMYSHYNSVIDARIANLQASIYGDDFYDGGPGKIPSLLLPDSVQSSLSERIGMDVDLTAEEMIGIFERFCIFYMNGKNPRHQPHVEVW